MGMQAIAIGRHIHAGHAARREAQRRANPYSVVERYTQSVRRTILHARSEALARNQNVITVADLLAGLCEQDGTRAERIGELKDNAQYLRWFAGLPPLPRPRPLPGEATLAAHCELDSEARRALLFAVIEADRDREHWIDSDHILRGLLRFPNRAQFAILKTELNLPKARLASFHDRDQCAPEGEPHLSVIGTFVQKHMRHWAPPLISAACYLYILLQTMGPRLIPIAR